MESTANDNYKPKTSLKTQWLPSYISPKEIITIRRTMAIGWLQTAQPGDRSKANFHYNPINELQLSATNQILRAKNGAGHPNEENDL